MYPKVPRHALQRSARSLVQGRHLILIFFFKFLYCRHKNLYKCHFIYFCAPLISFAEGWGGLPLPSLKSKQEKKKENINPKVGKKRRDALSLAMQKRSTTRTQEQTSLAHIAHTEIHMGTHISTHTYTQTRAHTHGHRHAEMDPFVDPFQPE
jgi:hypothetical protein